MLPPLTTQLVGSYSQPAWLVRYDRRLAHDGSGWRPEADALPAAKEDAARLAIYEQERAGLDLITDGEQQRLHYAGHFLARLRGVDAANPAERMPMSYGVPTVTRRAIPTDEQGVLNLAPRIVGPLEWPGPLAVDELRFLRRHTRKPVKVTVGGPLTLLDFLADEYYGDEEQAALALAAVLNQELRALEAAGADLIQLDDPRLHMRAERARRFGAAAINRTVAGIRTPVVVHVCYGYAYYVEKKDANPAYAAVLDLLAGCDIAGMSIEYEQPGHTPELLAHCGDKAVILGLLNLGTEQIETPEYVAARLRAAYKVVSAERLHPAPDCGMWHLPREVAYAKIRALVLGTQIVRFEQGL